MPECDMGYTDENNTGASYNIESVKNRTEEAYANRDLIDYASSVMMAKNSCSLISPSWSRSNSSIMACLFHTVST